MIVNPHPLQPWNPPVWPYPLLLERPHWIPPLSGQWLILKPRPLLKPSNQALRVQTQIQRSTWPLKTQGCERPHPCCRPARGSCSMASQTLNLLHVLFQEEWVAAPPSCSEKRKTVPSCIATKTISCRTVRVERHSTLPLQLPLLPL